MEHSSYASEVSPFPEHSLPSDTPDGAPLVPACVAETDSANECICHFEVILKSINSVV